ncbi:MAG TPA: hypothetical protein DEG96_02030 [Candidatus Atribacteria bacterium]|uniref:Uncharacterized protein n=1 Tax=candidate division TA06 bacterium 34_109 TaxID=1635277 RepID=A0A101HZ00_UNCT6|nr:MAG: hypothetical protein XE03_1926 [candidate division TA06 bacterium 34_109]HBY56632.1 hypothetical protein [Candidatus Atribacteria bacterium]
MGLVAVSQKESVLRITFYLLVTSFVLAIGVIFIPVFRVIFNSIFMITISAILIVLSSILIGLTLVQKVERKLKKFLILTGASTAGFFICVLLHNIFYALSLVTSHITILSYLMKAFEVIFFLVAIFACPIGFLVGVIGSVVLLIKERKSKERAVDQVVK